MTTSMHEWWVSNVLPICGAGILVCCQCWLSCWCVNVGFGRPGIGMRWMLKWCGWWVMSKGWCAGVEVEGGYRIQRRKNNGVQVQFSSVWLVVLLLIIANPQCSIATTPNATANGCWAIIVTEKAVNTHCCSCHWGGVVPLPYGKFWVVTDEPQQVVIVLFPQILRATENGGTHSESESWVGIMIGSLTVNCQFSMKLPMCEEPHPWLEQTINDGWYALMIDWRRTGCWWCCNWK